MAEDTGQLQNIINQLTANNAFTNRLSGPSGRDLPDERDSIVKSAHSNVDMISDIISQAVNEGDQLKLDAITPSAKAIFGPAGIDVAKQRIEEGNQFRVETGHQGPLDPNIETQGDLARSRLVSPGVDPNAPPGTLPIPDKGPLSTDDFFGDFIVPALFGVHPGKLILRNMKRIDDEVAWTEEYNRQIIKQQQTSSWYSDYNNLREGRMPHNEIVSTLASRYGMVPKGASILGPPTSDELDAKFLEGLANRIVNVTEGKRPPTNAEMLHALNEQWHVGGGYIPDDYRELYFDLVGLGKPDLSDPFKRELFAAQGGDTDIPTVDEVKTAERNLLISDDVKKYLNDIEVDWRTASQAVIDVARAKIQQAEEADKIRMEESLAFAEKAGSVKSEFALESERPIPGKMRVQFGIGSEIPTLEDLANRGLRLPTALDRSIYKEIRDLRGMMAEMDDRLFGKEGVFIGIGDSWPERLKEALVIGSERFQGTKRGQNFQFYTKQLGVIGRRMLSVVEKGGRFTNQDMEQILKSAPKASGVPDSLSVARDSFDLFVIKAAQFLKEMEDSIILKPIGQPQATQTDKPATHRWNPKTRELEVIK